MSSRHWPRLTFLQQPHDVRFGASIRSYGVGYRRRSAIGVFLVKSRKTLLELGEHDLQRALHAVHGPVDHSDQTLPRAHQIAELGIDRIQEGERHEPPLRRQVRDVERVLRIALHRPAVDDLLPLLRMRGQDAHDLEAALIEEVGQREAVDAGELDRDDHLAVRGACRDLVDARDLPSNPTRFAANMIGLVSLRPRTRTARACANLPASTPDPGGLPCARTALQCARSVLMRTSFGDGPSGCAEARMEIRAVVGLG